MSHECHNRLSLRDDIEPRHHRDIDTIADQYRLSHRRGFDRQRKPGKTETGDTAKGGS
jgi:hypothetical protein